MLNQLCSKVNLKCTANLLRNICYEQWKLSYLKHKSLISLSASTSKGQSTCGKLWSTHGTRHVLLWCHPRCYFVASHASPRAIKHNATQRNTASHGCHLHALYTFVRPITRVAACKQFVSYVVQLLKFRLVFTPHYLWSMHTCVHSIIAGGVGMQAPNSLTQTAVCTSPLFYCHVCMLLWLDRG